MVQNGIKKKKSMLFYGVSIAKSVKCNKETFVLLYFRSIYKSFGDLPIKGENNCN